MTRPRMPTTPRCSSSPRPPQLQPFRSRRAPMRTSSNPGQTRFSPGAGDTYDGGPFQTYLQWAPTVVQDSDYCAQFNPYFDASRLCTVDPPSFLTGTCNGDSGGRSPPTARPGSSSKSVSPPRAPPTAARAPRITSPPPSPLRTQTTSPPPLPTLTLTDAKQYARQTVAGDSARGPGHRTRARPSARGTPRRGSPAPSSSGTAPTTTTATSPSTWWRASGGSADWTDH